MQAYKAVFQYPTNLWSLCIKYRVNCSLTDLILKKNSCLIELCLGNCKIGAETAISLADAISSNSTLQKLVLRVNPIKERGFTALADMLRVNKALETLDLLGCMTRDVGIRNILDALHCNSSVKCLMLSDKHISTAHTTDMYRAIPDCVQWYPDIATEECLDLSHLTNINTEFVGK